MNVPSDTATERSTRSVSWLILALFWGLATVAAVALAFAPYDAVREGLQSLRGRPSLFYTQAFHQKVVFSAVVAAAVAAAMLALTVWKKRAVISLCDAVRRSFGEFCRDLRQACATCFAPRNGLTLVTLLCILAGAVAVRVSEIDRPPYTDEAKTWIWFVKASWSDLLSNYYIPGNHILQSALSRVCFLALGDSPWVYRLPLFAAGLLTLPLAYLLISKVFNSKTALVSVALMAFSHPLIHYSVDARGYAIIVLLSLVLLLLACYLRVKRSSPAAWTFFVLVAALGMWVVPSMLIPIGAASLWILLESPRSCGKTVLKLAVAGVATICLTLVFYSPVILRMGLTPIVANDLVTSLTFGEFLRELPRFAISLEGYLLRGLPLWGRIVGWAFLIIGIGNAVAKRHWQRVTLALAVFGFLFFFVTAKRILPHARQATTLVPVMYAFVADGLLVCMRRLAAFRIRAPQVSHRWEAPIAPIISLVMVAAFSLAMFVPGTSKALGTGQCKSVQAIARDLASELTEDDMVQVETPLYCPLMYYFVRNGIGTERLFWPSHAEDRSELRQSRRVFTVVSDRLVPLASYFDGRGTEGDGFTSPVIWKRYEDGEVYVQHAGETRPHPLRPTADDSSESASVKGQGVGE